MFAIAGVVCVILGIGAVETSGVEPEDEEAWIFGGVFLVGALLIAVQIGVWIGRYGA